MIRRYHLPHQTLTQRGDGLAVDNPALGQELGVGAPVTPARMGTAELAELLAQGPVPVGPGRLMTLGGAVLPDQPARPPAATPQTPVADG